MSKEVFVSAGVVAVVLFVGLWFSSKIGVGV